MVNMKKLGLKSKHHQMKFLNLSNLLIKINCPTENETNILKEKSILVGMFNPSKNKNQINKIINKKKNIFLWNYYLV